MRHLLYLTIGVSLLFSMGCKEDDPEDTSATEEDTSTEVVRSNCALDAVDGYTENVSACVPLATDYMPTTPDADSWATCISDDNSYHRIEESISSIARVEAYETIADLLWQNANVPTPQDFIDARLALDSEEGLGSRIDRRYDVHYEAPADGAACDEEGVAPLYPDYCVGPAVLRPLINTAFAAVENGEDAVTNAEIIHAAIQWFLYVSSVKEATTCTTAAKDCDSAWAYYSGGTERDAPIGLAAEIRELSPTTHERAYDGVLGVRCWRDLDSAEEATDLDLRDLTISQFDTALLRGITLLLRQRFVVMNSCIDSNEQIAAHEALKILVPLMDLSIRAQAPAAAETLATEVAKETTLMDTSAAIAALDSVFVCP